MTEERNKWMDAVAKMIQLTQAGEIKWKAVMPDASLGKHSDDIIDVFFYATYREKRFRLYERTYKAQRPPANLTVQELFRAERETESYWATEVILEFISSDGLALWTYPQISALSDLMSAVQYQVAGVKDFLRDLLSDEQQKKVGTA